MVDRINAQRAEIARRYKRRRKHKPTLVGLRVRDLNKLLTARYGHTLPDDDAGRDDVSVICHHLAQYQEGNPAKRITNWIELRAPWMTIGEIKAIIAETITKPQRWKADTLAWRMRLTAADRTTLRITTIGAIDENSDQRTTSRKARAKIRAQSRRRARGAKPRAQYLAAIKSDKPWIAAGISRATWFRRKQSPAS